VSAVGRELGHELSWEVILAAVLLLAPAGFVTAYPPIVSATQGTPDPCGYRWTDSNALPPKVNFNWIEIKDNGTLIHNSDWIGNADDGYLDVPFGFGFAFYDRTYSDGFLGTNGYISFGQGYTDSRLAPIPDSSYANNAVYGFGEDLQPGAAASPGGVYYLRLVTPYRFVLEYLEVPHLGGGDVVTFEIILLETGHILLQYLSPTGTVQVVGIENRDGSAGLEYPQRPIAQLAIEFAPASDPPGPVGVSLTPCAQRAKSLPDADADARFTVANIGTGSDTIDVSFSSPSPGWGAPTRIETGTRDASAPRLAVDPSGSVVAVWAQSDDNLTSLDIRANRFTPGSGWETPTLIEDLPGAASSPDVGVDSAGNEIAVWAQLDGAVPSIYANRFVPGTGWGTAAPIEASTAYASNPVVAVDPDGSAVAIWTSYEEGHSYNDLWANRFVPGSGWGTPSLLENNTRSAQTGDIAMDPGGNAIALWMQQQVPGSGTYDVWADRFVPGSGWGTATLIEDGPGHAEPAGVAMDSGGNGIAVFIQDDGTRYNNWANRFVPGSGWGTATLIENGPGNVGAPAIAVDSVGNATAVWAQSDGTVYSAWANRFVPGSGWGTASLIEANTSNVRFTSVGTDSAGNAIAVWTQFDGTVYNVWANQFVPESGWESATLIETKNRGDSYDPRVVVDPAGDAVAGWAKYDGSSPAVLDIWANRFVFSSGLAGKFYQSDGATPLADTNGDGVPDTGSLASGSSADVILRIHVTSGTGSIQLVTIRGRSSIDTSILDTSYVWFVVLSALLNPPHFDYGLDTNGNAEFDWLIMAVNLTVAVQDTYLVEAALRDATGALSLYNATRVSLGAGPATVGLGYDGRAINASGMDGPYTMEVQLRIALAFTPIDRDKYVTKAYSHWEFETPPAVLSPPHSESGVDVDADGRYDFLNLSVNLTVNSADLFSVSGTLSDPTSTFFVSATGSRFLVPGPAVLNLSFDGGRINGSGRDGPYFVDLRLYDTGSILLALGYNRHITAAYRHTQFEEIPSIRSVVATMRPTINGIIGAEEWSDAAIVDLSTIPGSTLSALLYLMDDYTTLYVAYDAPGDTTQDPSDAASISFDTGNDGNAVRGHEDEFVQGGFAPNNQAHYVYDTASAGWVVEDSPYDHSLPNHTGLASARGFGTSPNSATNHRMYEFAIPFALLGADLGATLGFIGGSAVAAGVIDGPTSRSSSWPGLGFLPLYAYGDLVFAPDSTAPTVAIISPAPGTIFDVDSVESTWTGSDVGLGLDHFAVKVDDGTPVSLPSNATSYTFTSLADGIRLINVTAVDRAGNAAWDTVSIAVDTTPPAVAISSPAPGTYLAAGEIVVTWAASDAVSGVHHFEVSLDGTFRVTLPASESTFTYLGVGDGSHTVAVTAVDVAGYSRTTSVLVTVDTIVPTVNLLSPPPGSLLNVSTVTVTWDAADSGSGVDFFELSVDGGPAIEVPGGARSYVLAALSDGSHRVEIVAVDRAGNRESAMVTLTVDATSPSLSITSPGTGAVIPISAIALSWTSSDATSGVNHFELSLDGGVPIILGAGSLSYLLSGVADGSHTIRLRSVDGAGNIQSASVTLVVDTTAPSVGITSPTNGGFVGSSVRIAWTAQDATSGIDHYTLTLDDGLAVQIPGSDSEHTFASVPEGLRSVTLTAFDRANHDARSNVIFFVDSTPPVLALQSPANGAVVGSGSVLVTWTASDSGSGLARVEIVVDDASAIVLSGQTSSYTVTGAVDGTHTIVVRVVDRAGNAQQSSISVRVDTAVLSPSGPYGIAPLGGLSISVIVGVLSVMLVMRRRKRAPPPSSRKGNG